MAVLPKQIFERFLPKKGESRKDKFSLENWQETGGLHDSGKHVLQERCCVREESTARQWHRLKCHAVVSCGYHGGVHENCLVRVAGTRRLLVSCPSEHRPRKIRPKLNGVPHSCFSSLWLLRVMGNFFWFLDRPPVSEGLECSSSLRLLLIFSLVFWQLALLLLDTLLVSSGRASLHFCVSCAPPRPLFLVGGFSFAGCCWTHSKTKWSNESIVKVKTDSSLRFYSLKGLLSRTKRLCQFRDVRGRLVRNLVDPAASRKADHQSQRAPGKVSIFGLGLGSG